jgi:hypothetical protein
MSYLLFFLIYSRTPVHVRVIIYIAFIHVAWELINIIPKNKEIEEEIRKYGEPNVDVSLICKFR